MFKKSHGVFLDTLDFIFNKLIPKKYTIMIIVCIMTYIMKTNPPDAFYGVVGLYIGGDTVVKSIKKRKGDKGGPE